MSVDTMHSLFKTGERFLQLTHQLLNPPFQMQPALLDELLADPDARLSALMNAILDGIVALESQAAQDEDPTADTTTLRNNAFPNPALPITRRSTPTITGETPPLPAPFHTAYQDDSRFNLPARQTESQPTLPPSPGLLKTLADLNIPLPGTRKPSGVLTSNELNWPSTADNRNRFSGSDVPDINYPAGQVASENSSPARMRLTPAEQSEVGRSNYGDSTAMPRMPMGKPDEHGFERQAPTRWPGNKGHEVTGAPAGDNRGQVNNVTGQTGWDKTSEREAETAARLPHIDTDARPVVSRSVRGAAKIASVLRANISKPSLPQQGSPEFAGYEFAENERHDLDVGEIGAKAGESWAKPAPPPQTHSPTAANIGETAVQRETLPISAHEKATNQTNAVDLEKLVEQLADYLEFEFQRTYGTSGGAL